MQETGLFNSHIFLLCSTSKVKADHGAAVAENVID